MKDSVYIFNNYCYKFYENKEFLSINQTVKICENLNMTLPVFDSIEFDYLIKIKFLHFLSKKEESINDILDKNKNIFKGFPGS